MEFSGKDSLRLAVALRSSWKTSRLAALILWLGGILWVAGMIWSKEPALTLTTTLELWRSSTWRCWTLFFSATLQLQSSTPSPQNMLELLLKVHSTVSSPRWSFLCCCILSTNRRATWTADLIIVDASFLLQLGCPRFLLEWASNLFYERELYYLRSPQLLLFFFRI